MNILGTAVAEQVSKNLGESQAEKQRDNWKWDAVCAIRAVTETRGGLRGCDMGSGSTCTSLYACMPTCIFLFHALLVGRMKKNKLYLILCVCTSSWLSKNILKFAMNSVIRHCCKNWFGYPQLLFPILSQGLVERVDKEQGP